MKLTHITIEDENGNIGVRWMKSDNVPHRAMFECGADIDWMFEQVRKDRASKGFTLNAADLEKIKAFAAIAWSPDLLAVADERKAAADAAFRAEEAARSEAEAKAASDAKAEADANQARFDDAVANALARYLGKQA